CEYRLSQPWSRYFYETPDTYGLIDGLCYLNAHNDEPAILLYERARDALHCTAPGSRRDSVSDGDQCASRSSRLFSIRREGLRLSGTSPRTIGARHGVNSRVNSVVKRPGVLQARQVGESDGKEYAGLPSTSEGRSD